MSRIGLERVGALAAVVLTLAVLGGCQRGMMADEDDQDEYMSLRATACAMNGGPRCAPGMQMNCGPGGQGMMGGCCNRMMAMMSHGGKLPAGVPMVARLIGGGVRVEFDPETDGLIYVVDAESKRLLSTRMISADSEPFTKDLTLKSDLGEYRSLMGLAPDAAVASPRLLIYFATYDDLGLPAPATQPSEEEGTCRPHP
jgi:hypothetical protein